MAAQFQRSSVFVAARLQCCNSEEGSVVGSQCGREWEVGEREGDGEEREEEKRKGKRKGKRKNKWEWGKVGTG
jgi:hypothetical protein